ncbi:thioredoxin family protein [Streptomyces tendae]
MCGRSTASTTTRSPPSLFRWHRRRRRRARSSGSASLRAASWRRCGGGGRPRRGGCTLWGCRRRSLQAVSPVLENVSKEPENSGIDFHKVDVDYHQDIAQEVGIKAMPTFVVFKDGNKVGELVGASPAGLKQLVQQGNAL